MDSSQSRPVTCQRHNHEVGCSGSYSRCGPFVRIMLPSCLENPTLFTSEEPIPPIPHKSLFFSIRWALELRTGAEVMLQDCLKNLLIEWSKVKFILKKE